MMAEKEQMEEVMEEVNLKNGLKMPPLGDTKIVADISVKPLTLIIATDQFIVSVIAAMNMKCPSLQEMLKPLRGKVSEEGRKNNGNFADL